MKKNSCCLRFIGDYTPQLCEEYYRDPYMTQSKAVFFFFRGSLGMSQVVGRQAVMLGFWGMRFMFG